MATKTKDWRAELTASRCLKHLVQEKLFTDVTFIFPNDNNESCTGHKLILSMRSAVFEAMFYGPLAKDDDEVKISDIEKNTFEMLLRYVYTDELGVDGETVLKCLYAAKKYCIDGMVKMCSDFLEASVAVHNACSNYEHAKFYELQGLLETCKTFMTTNAEDILKHDDFFSLTNQSLSEFLANRQLKPNEALYFDAANRWSEHECLKRDLEICPKNKQTLLGQALKEIKFALMTPQEFAEHVPETGLIDKDDQSDIYRWILTKKLHGSQVSDKFKSLPRQSQTLPIPLNTSNCTEGTTLPNESRFTIQSNEPIRITSIVMETSNYKLSSVTVSESEEEERPKTLSNMNVLKTYIFEEDLKVKANTTVTLKFKFNRIRRRVNQSSSYENVNHKHYHPIEPEHVFGGLVVNCTEFSEYMSTINLECC
ncbi:BTB/POZ domain-containing protein 3-like [Mya arenaria]|uniref:BTB/POZ domain-containing protein 3-like n=1 Tax=Mya arenaria TaxID=6604 RepID=UPI0022DEACD9|nr:BTB/POZ domain-containing protein 3-like [Mya arenaria]XP_052813557.1 BTB/POZ domain-containing protein 3-like [Mya arenaria]